jgi:hypothetical protein
MKDDHEPDAGRPGVGLHPGYQGHGETKALLPAQGVRLRPRRPLGKERSEKVVELRIVGDPLLHPTQRREPQMLAMEHRDASPQGEVGLRKARDVVEA